MCCGLAGRNNLHDRNSYRRLALFLYTHVRRATSKTPGVCSTPNLSCKVESAPIFPGFARVCRASFWLQQGFASLDTAAVFSFEPPVFTSLTMFLNGYWAEQTKTSILLDLPLPLTLALAFHCCVCAWQVASLVSPMVGSAPFRIVGYLDTGQYYGSRVGLSLSGF